MFCPDIKGKCVGEKCRDWDTELGVCRKQIVMKSSLKSAEEGIQFFKRTEKDSKLDAERIKIGLEAQNRFSLFMRLTLSQLLRDPTIDEQEKEAIKQALEAPTSEVAEKLLRDAGLIS